MKTAVEWLENEMQKTYIFNQNDFDMFKQAKELEKQQQGYSEEEVYDILIHHTVELFKKEPITLEDFWNKFKNK